MNFKTEWLGSQSGAQRDPGRLDSAERGESGDIIEDIGATVLDCSLWLDARLHCSTAGGVSGRPLFCAPQRAIPTLIQD